jgi:proteasome lid subunit RPN8/RPN11
MPDNAPCPDCDTVVLSDRTYRAILSETASFGDRETGGLLLGNFHNRFWYIMEGIDPGFRTVNRTTDFEYQVEYVNHLSKKIGVLYKHPLTIVGLWHRHPGDMDTFSDIAVDAYEHLS